MCNCAILKKTSNQGSALILVLVFGSIFIISFGALIALILAEHKAMDYKIASTQALEIAEAGINEYRWRLAHDADDYAGADEDYYDPYGNLIGHYTLTVTPPESGENTVTLTSIGYAKNFPNTKRIVRAKYGKPTVADFAIVSDANIWFGEDEEIFGKVHANGGIRMDGYCNSEMSTIKETYICGPEHGCADEEKPGIWGTGEIQDLWTFPVTEGVDFDTLTVDYDALQLAAIADGIHLNSSGKYGYQIVFDGDKLDINTVSSLESPVWGYDGTSWLYQSDSIKRTTALSGYQDIPLPANGLIFIEDEVWVEGNIDGKVTVVAARLPSASNPHASIRIQNDIRYKGDKDDTYAVGLIAQKDILIPLISDATLRIDASLIAQTGHVFRYYYPVHEDWCRTWCSKEPYTAYSIRSVIQIFGMIMSKEVWTFSWISDDTGNVVSGYDRADITYDPYLKNNPPLYFPTTGDYRLISWEEILPTQL